jgi:hypothetical protein
VFFHLMRSHMGAEQVDQIAMLAVNGVTGSGIRYDMLMPLCEQLAEQLIDPPRLLVSRTQ